MIVVLWFGVGKNLDNFAALDLHMISWAKVVIMFVICETYAPCLVVVTRIADDMFWHQLDGAAANSLAVCLVATSVANRHFEVISSFSCFTHLNESVVCIYVGAAFE